MLVLDDQRGSVFHLRGPCDLNVRCPPEARVRTFSPQLVMVSWEVLKPLGNWLSTFLMLRPFNTILHVVVTLDHKIISLLLFSYNSATVMKYNAKVSDL